MFIEIVCQAELLGFEFGAFEYLIFEEENAQIEGTFSIVIKRIHKFSRKRIKPIETIDILKVCTADDYRVIPVEILTRHLFLGLFRFEHLNHILRHSVDYVRQNQRQRILV